MAEEHHWRMITNLGKIKVEEIKEERNDKAYKYYRLTLECPSVVSLDSLEGQGETLAEALLNLHEEVEAYER